MTGNRFSHTENGKTESITTYVKIWFESLVFSETQTIIWFPYYWFHRWGCHKCILLVYKTWLTNPLGMLLCSHMLLYGILQFKLILFNFLCPQLWKDLCSNGELMVCLDSSSHTCLRNYNSCSISLSTLIEKGI